MEKLKGEYFQVPNAVFDQYLRPDSLAVYLYIMRCANNGGDAYPSYATIGVKCGMSTRQAIRAVSNLKQRKLIDAVTVREGRHGCLNHYAVLPLPTYNPRLRVTHSFKSSSGTSDGQSPPTYDSQSQNL